MCAPGLSGSIQSLAEMRDEWRHFLAHYWQPFQKDEHVQEEAFFSCCPKASSFQHPEALAGPDEVLYMASFVAFIATWSNNAPDYAGA